MRVFQLSLLGTALALAAVPVHSAVTDFNLTGKAGDGLLPGNENHTVNGSPGIGGEIAPGISYNDVTNILTINIGWGKQNGFPDNLNGNATMGHIHGPTLSPAPQSFLQDANVLIPLDSLPGWDPNPTKGGFIGPVSIPQQNEADLFAGKLYINIHTQLNSAGEIRGYLVPIPEPGAWALMLAGLAGLGVVLRGRGG